MHIEPGTTLKISPDHNLLILKFEESKYFKAFYEYEAKVLTDEGVEVNTFSSAVAQDVVDMWVRRDAVLTGKYENVYERPLVLTTTSDPMRLEFALGNTRWKLTLDWVDTPLAELEQYANELYAMDICAVSKKIGGAFHNSRDCLSLRQFFNAETEGWGKAEVSQVSPTLTEYKRRLNEFTRIGEKDFS